MTAKTVAICVALVLVGVLAGIVGVLVGTNVSGVYAFSTPGSAIVVVRMNTRTGELSLCQTMGLKLPAKCGPWGPVSR